MTKSIRKIFFGLVISVSFVSFYSGLFLVLFVIRDFQSMNIVLFEQGLIIPLLSLAPLAFGVALIVAYYIRNSIDASPLSLKNILNELNSIEDLAKIDFNKYSLFFKEYDVLLFEIEKYLKRVKQLAVDRGDLNKL